MSATGLEVFDKTIQTANIWVDEIMEELGPDRQNAWHVLSAVLRTLRDRLPPDLAAHLGAQLPLIVRGAYYDQYRPSTTPDGTRSLDDFLGRIGEKLQSTRPVNSADALRVVCEVLAHHVEPGQMNKVLAALPEEIRHAAQPRGKVH